MEFREQTVTTDPTQFKFAIADFYFRKSQTKFRYERNVGDLWAILSYLAGNWSSCYVCFLFILRSYNRNFFINSLSNKLYSFPSQKKKKKNVRSEIEQIEINPNKSLYQKILEKIKIYLSYDEKLKIMFFKMWEYMIKNLFSFIKFKDETMFLMEKSQENLMCDLDICNILKKLQEFDKVKNLLFTEDQQYVLSFTPKPDILTKIEEENLQKKPNKSYIPKRKKTIKRKERLLSDSRNFEDLAPIFIKKLRR